MTKKTMIGQCALCLSPDEVLQLSHYMPKALYKLCREDGGADPDPILVTAKVAVRTSEQVTKHALCRKCEDRFQKSESYLLARCYRRPGRFLLRDALHPNYAHPDDPGRTTYLASQVPEVNAERLLHFAASIYWRGSAIQWPSQNTFLHALGPRYEEELRKFLCGLGPFPKNVALTLIVESEPEPDLLFSFPVAKKPSKERGYRYHDFPVPGLRFRLCVGNQLPVSIRRYFSTSPEEVFIMVESMNNLGIFEQYASVVKNAVPKGKLAKRGWSS